MLSEGGLHAVRGEKYGTRGLEQSIEELVEGWALRPLGVAWQALRGVQLVAAVVLAAGIGDFQRFADT